MTTALLWLRDRGRALLEDLFSPPEVMRPEIVWAILEVEPPGLPLHFVVRTLFFDPAKRVSPAWSPGYCVCETVEQARTCIPRGLRRQEKRYEGAAEVYW